MKFFKKFLADRRANRSINFGDVPLDKLLSALVGTFKVPLRQTEASAFLEKAQSFEGFLSNLNKLNLEYNSGVLSSPSDLDALGQLFKKGLVLTKSHSSGKYILCVGLKEQTVLGLDLLSGAVTELDSGDISKASFVQFRRIKDPSQELESFGWSWFLKAFFKNKEAVRHAVVASLVLQLIGLGFPLATQAIVDKVIPNQALNTLIALGSGVAIFALFNAVISWLRQQLLLRLANKIDANLAQEVYERLVTLPLNYFESRATGVIINRVHGVERVREFFAGAFLLIVLELPFMLIFLGLMLFYSLQLSAIVLGFLALMLVVSFAVGPVLRERSQVQFTQGAKLQGFMTEQIAATETLKSLQLESSSQRQFAELNSKYLEATLHTKELGNSYGTFMQLCEQLMNVSVLCLGAYIASDASSSTGLTIGMLVAFQMFASKVTQPLLKLSGYWQELQQVRTAISQLGDVMNTAPENYRYLASSVSAKTGSLSIQGLGFRYAGNRPFLYEDFNADVAPGSLVLITGPSGSGKSTLAKILQGLYPAYSGTIKIDDRDIRSMSVNELRSYFGVVPQEAVLFSGSIQDNLLDSAPGSNLEHAVQACKMAGIHTEIENLPEGYATKLGERGVGLSGGQRQRIAIARALLKRPKILVLDEATSGLDSASAEKIAHAVNALKGKVSILFIAHKVPTSLLVDTHLSIGRTSLKNSLSDKTE